MEKQEKPKYTRPPIPASLPKDFSKFGTIRSDASAKGKRQGTKFFDSAEWVMDGKKLAQNKRALSEPLPKPTEDQIAKYISLYTIPENQVSPLTNENNLL